ncbi:MAG: hypothetical protein RIR49_1397 [Actinomycetota bacterium]
MAVVVPPMDERVDASSTQRGRPGFSVPTKDLLDPTPRPLGAISVIGDSVMLGSLTYSPNLVSRLADAGFGPIRARAGLGYGTGAFATAEWSRSSLWLQRWREEGWDAPTVLVNVGVNDSGLCRADRACSDRAIDHMMSTIGAGRDVIWPNITRSAVGSLDHQGTWNGALAAAAERHPNLHVWDWAAVYATGAFPSGDRIHLSPDGYRARNVLLADFAVAVVATTARIGEPVALPAGASRPTAFTPVPPTRVLDSRRDGAPLPPGGSVAVDLSGLVPAGAVAVALNLTSTGTAAEGFLTAHSCATATPDTSNVNHFAGRDRGAHAIVAVGADRRLCVASHAGGHVIVDLQGYFGVEGGLGFDSLSTPRRMLDTRHSGRVGRDGTLEIAMPRGASAVAITLTVTGADRDGYVTAHPCGSAIPDVSNVNFGPGEPVAGAAFVPVGPEGSICVHTALADVDVIVDLTGVFSPDAELGFVVAPGTRLLDTRSAIGGWGPWHSRDARLAIPAAPTGARAVSGTLTLVRPRAEAFLTAEPCGSTSGTSAVNALAGSVMANSVTVGVADGELCITASATGHTLFDLTGWWAPLAAT